MDLMSEAERPVGELHSVDDVLVREFERIVTAAEARRWVAKLSYGFAALDDLTQGLLAEQLVLVAGHSGVGRTAFVVNVVRHIATCADSASAPVLFVSPKVSAEEVARRLLQTLAGLDSQRLRVGHLTRDDWPKLTAAAGTLVGTKIFIDDRAVVTVPEIQAAATQLAKRNGLGLIVADFTHLTPTHPRATRDDELGDIARDLKRTAKALQVPILGVALAEHRAAESAWIQPQVDDAADVILYLQDHGPIDLAGQQQHVEVNVVQRGGPAGVCQLVFDRKRGRYLDGAPTAERASRSSEARAISNASGVEPADDDSWMEDGDISDEVARTIPPLVEPTPLTAPEISWVLQWAKQRAEVLGQEHEVALACCAASLLPYFKSAHLHEHKSVCIKRYLLLDAAASGWPDKLWHPETLIEVMGMLRVATRGGMHRGQARAASYALTIEIPLSRDVPNLALEPGPKITPNVRYRTLQDAAQGKDWRPQLGPLDTAGLRHLTPEEFTQLVQRFDVPDGAARFDSLELGVFCAQLLPRLKHAHAAGLPFALLTCGHLAECMPRRSPQELQKALDASAVFEAVPGWDNPLREVHLALRVRNGAFSFATDAPARPLCLRSGHDLQRRWLSIKRAAQGLDGRRF